jgi:hypothetical protein
MVGENLFSVISLALFVFIGNTALAANPEAENICFCLNSRKNRLGKGNP